MLKTENMFPFQTAKAIEDFFIIKLFLFMIFMDVLRVTYILPRLVVQQ